ncbi:MAG: tetratricopeptide repeat protein [Akkermansiaceae bacterium]
MTKHIILSLMGICSLHSAKAAEPLIAPTELFRQPGFAKEFVGSYGILSDVEPDVTDTEQKLLGQLQALFAESKFKEAENQLVLYIKETTAPTDPNLQPGEISPALVFVLGNLYFQSERLNDAERAFKESIKRFPKFRRAYTNLGFLYTSQNKMDEALAAFQKSVELGEKSARVMGMLGYCYMFKQNAVAAENAYRQAYLIDPNARDWKLGLAQCLLMQDKYEDAASMFGNLIKENTQDRQLWMRQTSAYLAMEKFEDAIINLEMMRLMGLADEKSLVLLGNIYIDQSQPRLALDAFSDAMNRAPQIDVAQALKSAKILNDNGNPKEASEMVQKIRAAAGDKINPADRLNLDLTEVKIARNSNQPDVVGTILTRLLKENPTNPDILLELARHYDQCAKNETDEEKVRKHIGEAKTNYMLAMQHEATSYAANLGYGQLLIRANRALEALPFIEKALSLKKTESLEQYASRVRRAADREKARLEREQAERDNANSKK